MTKNYMKLFPIFLLLAAIFFVEDAFAQDLNEINEMFTDAQKLFLKGEYKNSIKIYDEILEIHPENYKILEMKGLALSNLRLESTLASQAQSNAALRDPSNLNKLSMLEFYRALEINPNSIHALNGMGLGFGNFVEYCENAIPNGWVLYDIEEEDPCPEDFYNDQDGDTLGDPDISNLYCLN